MWGASQNGQEGIISIIMVIGCCMVVTALHSSVSVYARRLSVPPLHVLPFSESGSGLG